MPFLLSLVLLVISIYIRLKLNESPVFQQMKAQGKGSKAPLTDSFLALAEQQVRAPRAASARRPARAWSGTPASSTRSSSSPARSRSTGDGVHADRRSRCSLGTPFFVIFGWLVRPHRPPQDHPRRLPARGADLLPDLPGADPRHQSRRSRSSRAATRSPSPPPTATSTSSPARTPSSPTATRSRTSSPSRASRSPRNPPSPARR